MMLTCPSRKVWRTGSNSVIGRTSASAHHRTVRRSSAAQTARRLTATRPKRAARFTQENATSHTRAGRCAKGAKSRAEKGG